MELAVVRADVRAAYNHVSFSFILKSRREAW